MKRNRSKRMASQIMAGMLVMVLCLATSLTAMAGTTGTQAAPEEAEFTKTLQYANVTGMTTPNVTFNFTFTAVQKDGVTANATSMPSITPAGINFNGETATLNSATGMLEVTKTSSDVLSGINLGNTWYRCL